MITIDARNLSSFKKQTTIESLPFPGYTQYNDAETDVLQRGKRFDENLEDVYDRLKNDNIKISSRLRTCSVSDHLELAESQINQADHAETAELRDEAILFIVKPIHC